MGTLLLVRHGQADTSGDDYDRLTPKGVEQAHSLGAYWAARRVRFERIYLGPCRRHLQSFDEVRSAYDAAGLSLPAPTPSRSLDELPAVELTKRAAPTLAQRDPKIARWLQAMATGGSEAGKNLSRLVDHVTRLYAAGAIAFDDLETFAAFRSRVEHWLQDVMQEARGEDVVAFTSGGPIGVAVALALELTDEKVIDVIGMVRNTSFSEFRFNARKLSMVSFNAHPHLQQDRLTQI